MSLTLNPTTGNLDVINKKASKVKIVDVGSYYTGTEVETALQEIGAGTTLDSRYIRIDTASAQTLTADQLVLKGSANNTATLSVTQADGTAVFDVDTTNRKMVVTSGTTGQSTIGAGLIVNNDSGNGAINDFQVNSDTLTAILVDASADTMVFGAPIADKIMFTQADGNEYIDSLADGFMDYGATTAHRFLADVKLTADSRKVLFGAGDDMSIYYDGTDGYIKTDLITASDLIIDCGTDKTVELTVPVWNDLKTPVQAIRLSGSQPPTETLYKGGYVLSFPSNADKTIYFMVQLSHSYKEGTDLEFHVHQVVPTSGAGGGAENVKWTLTYSWANIGSVFPAATTVNTTVDVQNDVADTHYLKEVAATISGTGKTISSMLLCSLTRDTSVANDYADDVYITEVDFHFQGNSLGSRQDLAK